MTEKRHQIYVVEGPDCSGKTTLVDAMVKQLGAAKLHLTYRFKNRMDLYHRWAIEKAIALSHHQPVIIDRWWPSEIVYARAFRVRTAWPRNARAFDRIGRYADVRYIFCVPNNKEEYVDAWYRDRERRYASKPHALKGRSAETDNMSKVYDLYQDMLTWMDSDNRLDLEIYDRFKWKGAMDDAASSLIARLDYPWMPNVENQLVIHPDLSRPGRHKVWPGATWTAEQRRLDSILEMLGVPDHHLEFAAPQTPENVTVDPVTMMAVLLTFKKPALLLDSSLGGVAKIMNATNQWSQTVNRVVGLDNVWPYIESLALKEVKDAAHRLGLA